MEGAIEVESEEELELIREGLEDDVARAFVKIVGALAPLGSDRTRRRVLDFIRDKVDEEWWGKRST